MDSIGFLGEYPHTLDPKGRVFVPKKFLEAMTKDEPRVLYVTKGLDGCLSLFTTSAWKDQVTLMRSKSEGDQETRHFRRVFFALASEQSIDASGRILIPERLRKVASLDREVMFVGMVDKIELWSKTAWDVVFGKINEGYDDYATEVLKP